MKKLFFKQFLLSCTLLLFSSNIFAIDYFTILVKIKPEVAKKSYNKLTKKYVTITDLNTNQSYLTNLENLLNVTYKRFYPSIWSQVNIFEITEPHFTLAAAGTVIQRGNNEYVRSNDGKTEVLLQTAIDTVENAINNNTQYYKNKFGQKYESRIGFNLKQGAEFLYDPTNTTAANVFVVQKLSFGKPGVNHRLYTLGTEIISELAKIGLNPKFHGFKPHVSLANLASSSDMINKLKDLEKNPQSGLAKLFALVSKTKKSPTDRHYFSEIFISKGTLKKSTKLASFDLK